MNYKTNQADRQYNISKCWRKWQTCTFTGWKNSSTTFCVLKSSEDEQTPEGINVGFDWVLIAELLVVGA